MEETKASSPPTTVTSSSPTTVTSSPQSSLEARLEGLLRKHRNAFTSSWVFRSMCRSAFKTVDIDESGRVSLSEAYVGVLLFYSKMSSFAKGLIPPTIDDVRLLFGKVTDDDSVGHDGFAVLLTLILEHCVFRVLLQIAITFVVIPPVAAGLWDLYSRLYLRKCCVVVSTFVPRAVGVNLSVSALSATLVPFVLSRYESITLAWCRRRRRGRDETPSNTTSSALKKQD